MLYKINKNAIQGYPSFQQEAHDKAETIATWGEKPTGNECDQRESC